MKSSKKQSKTTSCLFCPGNHHYKHCGLHRSDNMHNKIKVCMESTTMPDFESCSVEMLRYIAYSYIFKHRLLQRITLDNNHKENTFNKHPNFKKITGYEPLPFDCSKRVMVRMLKERWTSLSPIIKKKYEPAPKPSIESCCAICMEEMTFFEWSEYDGDYIEKTKITYCDSDKSGYNPILTKCGHVFCNACLKTMIHMNYEYNETVGRRDSLHVYADFPMKDFKSQVFHKSEFQVNSDDVKNHLTRFHAFKCPMCRSRTFGQLRLGLDKTKNWCGKRYKRCALYAYRPRINLNDHFSTHSYSRFRRLPCYPGL